MITVKEIKDETIRFALLTLRQKKEIRTPAVRISFFFRKNAVFNVSDYRRAKNGSSN